MDWRWNNGIGISRPLVLVFLLAVVLLAPTHSFAQMYVGIYGGGAFPEDSDIEIEVPVVNLLGLGDSTFGFDVVGDAEFDPGVMVGGRVGYWFEGVPIVGAEVDFYWANPEVSLKVAGPSLPIDEDLGVYTGVINLLVRYPYWPIQPYGGFGVGIVNVDFAGDSETAVAFQFMVGVRGFITDNIALFTEGKVVGSRLNFKGELKGSVEKLKFDYIAPHVYGGIEYHFGSGVKKRE